LTTVVACGGDGGNDLPRGGSAGTPATGGLSSTTGGIGNTTGGIGNTTGGVGNTAGGIGNTTGGVGNTTGGLGSSGGPVGGAAVGGAGTLMGGKGKEYGDNSCGAGVTMTRLGQCQTQIKGLGTTLTFANFEDAGADNDHLSVVFGDGRTGKFVKIEPPGAASTLKAEATAGPTGQSTQALHFSGAAPGSWGATVSMEPATCYDATAYRGISFWLKGSPAAGNDHLKVSLHTPLSQPEGADATKGGGCSAADATAMKCYDHYATFVEIKDGWTRYNIKWADFQQNCASNVPQGYNPAQYIIGISFYPPKADAGHDFWIDDVTLEPGDLEQNSDSVTKIVSKDTFEEMWTSGGMSLRNAFYTYDDMVAAAGGYGGFCTTGDARTRRLECAAFFANVGHETDTLKIIDEDCNAAGKNCAVYDGGANYHGRGPIQLTGQGNYNAAGSALGAGDLGGNPGRLSTDAPLAWKTGFWFWMNQAGAGPRSGHASMTGAPPAFGDSIRSINGAVECGGQQPAQIQNRIRLYKRFAYMLGIDPGDMGLGC
jgi:chitinase